MKLNNESNELIRKKDAIDEIAKWAGYLDEDMIYRIQLGLKRLPYAQPKQKTGEWIQRRHPNWDMQVLYCSECDKSNGNEYANYCPNCGAKMEVER